MGSLMHARGLRNPSRAGQNYRNLNGGRGATTSWSRAVVLRSHRALKRLYGTPEDAKETREGRQRKFPQRDFRLHGVSLGATLALVACGSRSGLLEPSADIAGGSAGVSIGGAPVVGGGGSGGLPTGGSGGLVTGGTAGAGGDDPCTTLAFRDPVVEIDKPASDDDQSPGLAFTSIDHLEVALAFSRNPLVPFGSGFGTLTLSPWGGWPGNASLVTVHQSQDPLLDVFGPPLFATDSVNGKIAVLLGSANAYSLFPEVDLSSSLVDGGFTVQSSSSPFLSRGPPTYQLVGTFTSAGTGSWMTAHVIGSSPVSVNEVFLGCASSPLAADAEGYGPGWLVAHSTAPNFAPELCTFGSPEPPSRIDFEVMVPGSTAVPLVSIQETAPIAEISTAPHPLGMYVVWRVASGGAIAPIRWARIDVMNGSVIGPGDVTGPGEIPLPGFQAAALGDRLAVVWGNDPAGNPPDLVVSVVDDAGTIAKATLPDRFHAPLAAVGAPTGDQLLITWQEATANGKHVIELSRVDCGSGI